MCLIRRSMGDDLHDGEWPMAEGRLRAAISAEYPYRFITRASVRIGSGGKCFGNMFVLGAFLVNIGR